MLRGFFALSHALSKIAPLVEIAAIQLAYGAFVILLFAAWNWPGKTLELVLGGAVSGIASMAGMLLLINAYALAPFIYCQIVIAAISGAVVFEDWPNMLSWIGIVVILLCGGFSASRLSGPKAQPG